MRYKEQGWKCWTELPSSEVGSTNSGTFQQYKRAASNSTLRWQHVITFFLSKNGLLVLTSFGCMQCFFLSSNQHGISKCLWCAHHYPRNRIVHVNMTQILPLLLQWDSQSYTTHMAMKSKGEKGHWTLTWTSVRESPTVEEEETVIWMNKILRQQRSQ